MSEEENAPAPGPQGSSQAKGGLLGHIKKHWAMYAIGGGGLLLVVSLMALKGNNQQQSNNAQDLTNGSYTVPSGGALDTMGGMSSDTFDSMYSMLQGLTSVEANNNNILQKIAGGDTTSGVPSGPVNSAPLPASKGTTGLSNNFWTYTTKAGDTLSSITKFAGWDPQHQKGGGTDFLYGYRNNAQIFGYYGVNPNDPNAKLPAGVKISL